MITSTHRTWLVGNGWHDLCCAALATVLAVGGCNAFPGVLTDAGTDTDVNPAMTARITADVSASALDTGLPQALTGTLTGDATGTYEEEIVEVFFGRLGVPIAAVSRSNFTFESPQQGTLTTFNSIVVIENVLFTDDDGATMLDDAGNPIVVGLRTAATGDIIHGTGFYENATGILHADSTVLLTGGEFGLGTLDSTVDLMVSQ